MKWMTLGLLLFAVACADTDEEEAFPETTEEQLPPPPPDTMMMDTATDTVPQTF